MGAVAVVSNGRGWEDAGRAGGGAARASAERPAQPRLFALPGGAVEDAPPTPGPVAVAAPTVAAEPKVRTLDDVFVAAWSRVAAGSRAVCPLCAGPLSARWSAGAGAVGGRCEDCGCVLD